MLDAFLTIPPMQPKREICDYLESEGIRVPERIANLKDAIRSGHNFIIRGEHPQDYNGASDLLHSIAVRPEMDFTSDRREYQTEQAVIEGILGDPSAAARLNIRNHLPLLSQESASLLITSLTHTTIKQYCSLLHISEEDYLRDVSFSYWRYIEGCNHTVIADSAIENRYHVFSCLMRNQDTIASYYISDNGVLTEMANESEKKRKLLEPRIPRLIDLYESVRKLPKFDPRHCPIIEIQTTNDEVDYCLQVHRTRDFEASQTNLDDVDGKTYASRGATVPGGQVYDVSIISDYKDNPLPEEFLPYAGSYLKTCSTAFIELNLRKKGLHLIELAENRRRFGMMKFAVKHASRSGLFKPPVTVLAPIGEIMNRREYEEIRDDSSKSIPVKITSDGRRALIERT